ncbi:MAG: hypothetical protein IJ094_00360 [Bacilli bacterium]|nr:hypothetical protein [Bacilli bacterium]
MTQKELAYIEDAISHEQIIISILEDMQNNLKDDNLISFISDELDNHNDIKEDLIELLKEKQNG